MGRKRDVHDLRWYEILLCCCKWKGESKSCVTITCMYYIPIILLIFTAGACITLGVIWREDCSYKPVVPYWVMISSVTPFIVIFISSKGANDKYLGVTFWRILSLVTYCLFTTWVILGSVWIYDTWIHSSDDECDKVIKLFSFVLVCVHWLIVVIVTIPQVYILTQICCCCTENAIKPLKRHRPTNWDDDVF